MKLNRDVAIGFVGAGRLGASLAAAMGTSGYSNAGRLVKEGGAQAVKLEGGSSTIVETVQALDDVGIAVMGHLGLTPQSVHKLGGYRVQGTSPSTAKQLLDDALLLQDAGAFSIVLELIPVELAREVTTRLSIPTIGIGSGIACDGQVQVWHDILGLSLDFMPRHARKFAEAGDMIRGALETYAAQVRNGSFPTEAETVHAQRPLELDEDTKSSRVTRLDRAGISRLDGGHVGRYASWSRSPFGACSRAGPVVGRVPLSESAPVWRSG